MSIVSQRIIEDYTSGGKRILRMGFTDHLGEEHTVRHMVNDDANTYLAAYVVEMESNLAAIELSDVESKIKNGEGLEDIYNSRQHSGRADLKAKILEVVGEVETQVATDQLVIDQKSAAQLFNGKI